MPSARNRIRQSSITVHVVDMEKAMKEFYEKNKESLGDRTVGLDTNSSKWGYAETPRGLYLLDHEACGPGGCEAALTDSGNKVELPLYRNMEGSFDMMSTVAISINADFVRGLDKIGEENLADFVRKWNSRLESNFDNWNRHLEAEIDGVQDERTSQAQ